MTLIQSRATLTHRMTVQRDATPEASATDPWGNPLPADWQDHLVDVPCKAWTVTGNGPRVTTEVLDSTNTQVVEERKAIVPLGTDIVETDRVSEITLRGETFFAGPMVIQAVLRYEDHLELVLKFVVRILG